MLHDAIYTNYLDPESSTDVIARNSTLNVYECIITGDDRVRLVGSIDRSHPTAGADSC